MHEGLQSCGGTYRKKKMRKNIASGVEILEDSCPGSNVLVLVVFVRPRATASTCTTVVYRAALVLREGRKE